MSAGRIKSAALSRFASQGYDATSLAEIAGDVGIKTPSIYAHFHSKQDLFRLLVEHASAKELEEVQKSLQQPLPVQTTMHRYLHGTVDRFATEPHLRFWLRSIYLPPPKLRAGINAHDKNFAIALEKIVAAALCHPEYGLKNPALPHATLAVAFIGILRGVHAVLLHDHGADSAKTLAALWAVFERSLTA